VVVERVMVLVVFGDEKVVPLVVDERLVVTVVKNPLQTYRKLATGSESAPNDVEKNRPGPDSSHRVSYTQLNR
jgi:hypothetical protein